MDGVFLSGGRGHDDLPLGPSCADVFVGPSVVFNGVAGIPARIGALASRNRRLF
jgi:hypothetical protein